MRNFHIKSSLKTFIFVFTLGMTLTGAGELFVDGNLAKAQEVNLTKGMQSFKVEGMPVILRETPSFADISSEIVSINLISYSGVEATPKAGALELLSNVMVRGTYSYSKDKIDQILNRTGASLSVRADFDEISVNLKCLKRFLPELMPIVSEIVRVPNFDKKEIELSKEQQMLELKSEQDSPDSLLSMLMHKVYYPTTHLYYQRPGGFLETVPGITKDDLTAALFKSFNQSNVFFVLVGPISRAETEEMVSKHFKGLQKGERSADFREQPVNSTAEVAFQKFDTPTDYFLARFKVPSLESAEYPALALGLQILDSRFFEEVRSKRALSYAVSASVGNSKVNSGVMYVSSPKLTEAVKVMYDELKKLQNEKVDDKTLKHQVNKALSSWYAARETRSSQARIFALYENYGIGWESADTYISRLEKVTPDQIQSAMKKYVKDMSYAVVASKPVDLSPILGTKAPALAPAKPLSKPGAK